MTLSAIPFRKSRRLIGRYQLSERDVLDCASFEDSIGVNGLGKVAFGSHKQYKKKARPQPHANKNRQCARQVCKALRYAERRSIRAKRPVVVSHDPAGGD